MNTDKQAPGGGGVETFYEKWKWLILSRCADEFISDLHALTTPPSSPVGVPVDVVREYLDARACYETATRPPNSHAPTPSLKHDDPTVLRLRRARVELNKAIAFAQQPSEPDVSMREYLIADQSGVDEHG